jgi:uncharacterized membrane protein
MVDLKRKLRYFIQEIRTSYWFIPGVMVCFTFLLSLYSIELDRTVSKEILDSLAWMFTNDPEAARVILSTIATATMGVAGVTFSMTLLSISFASAQIGPRIFSGFMRDRGNQFSLGVFIATFVYCVMVLRTIYSPNEGQAFVPNFSIILALSFAILSIFVLIYFINHIPMMMSMTNSVNRTGGQLVSSIKILFPKELGEGVSTLPKSLKDGKVKSSVAAKGKGYIEYVNFEVLMEICDDNDLLLEIIKRPGDFVSREITVAVVYSEGDLSDKCRNNISDTFIEGVNRSHQQDIRFPGNLLVEIAARALSPGVNDPFTAIDCMNQLQTGLLFMQHRDVPSKFRKGREGIVRVISDPINYEEFLLHILNSLRSFVKRDFLCTKHLMQILIVLSDHDKKERREIYIKQSHQLAVSFKDSTTDEMDINEISALRLN